MMFVTVQKRKKMAPTYYDYPSTRWTDDWNTAGLIPSKSPGELAREKRQKKIDELNRRELARRKGKHKDTCAKNRAKRKKHKKR